MKIFQPLFAKALFKSVISKSDTTYINMLIHECGIRSTVSLSKLEVDMRVNFLNESKILVARIDVPRKCPASMFPTSLRSSKSNF